MSERILLAFLCALAAMPVCVPASAAISSKSSDVTVAGDLWAEPPTLISLGFEWRITGDENRTAKVEVRFRQKGEATWHKALPLIRSQHEYVGDTAPPRENFHPDPFHYPVPNMFAGSIFNLKSDTEYECRFVLTDPDGVKGRAMRIVTVRTRKEPVPAPGGHVYHVYPIDWTGPKQQPAFTGLMEAYYQGAASSDYEGTYPARVTPGDIVLMHAGTYISDRVRYQNGLPHPGYNALSTLFDGTYYLTASGTEDKPIVIKAAGDGEVIFDGNGAQTFFNLEAANYNYFEGITFRNANLLFLLGQKDIVGSSGFTLKHSRIYNVGRGVQDDWSGSKNITILDNSFIGRHDPAHVVGWIGDWLKRPSGYEELGGPNGSEYGIKIYGQGHAVAYNYFANWHDGLDVATYGNPDGTPREVRDRVPVSIDFYNNDFDNMGDNCIEADGGAHNVRVFRNRCFNSTGGALSATPLVGGPVYFFQNLVYNTTTSGVTKYGSAAGIVTWQNTFVGAVRGNAPSMYFANNLMLSSGRGPIFAITTATNYSSSDYNGFRPSEGGDHAFEWNTPPFGTPIGPANSIVKRAYKTLSDYSVATGQDKHSVLLDYNVFAKASAPDSKDVEKVYAPEDFDFRLAPGSAAIDAGMVLPTINDDYTGAAPDLGAYEVGRPLPHYGPRTPVPGVPQGDGSLRTLAGPPEDK
ncbi:MAG: right-handed parallel beta-helix repeat-containing protein [Pseudomonadota bacterium]